MHCTPQTITDKDHHFLSDMAVDKNRVSVGITLGGKSLNYTVPLGEEDLARAAAELIEKRTKEFDGYIRQHGPKVGMAMIAFGYALEYLRLRSSDRADETGSRLSRLANRIEEELGD